MAPRYRACTIVARNYLAQAEVLADSFQKFHPDIEFYTLVIDGGEEDRGHPGVGNVVFAEDLGLKPRLLHDMVVMYDVMELATALKPAMLQWLIRKNSAAVAYFDPDIKVFADLTDVFEAAVEHEIVLTPHTLDPVPRDGKLLSEATIMQAGIYNLGFIAVGAAGYRFLSWWHERLKTDAIVEIASALFTDQRWIDWVPSLFNHVILKDRGLNAAYWNLHDREITSTADGYLAGDVPLRFFHFSGYDPATPWILSKHMGDNPRTVLSEHADLSALCGEYGADLIRAGHPERRKSPYQRDALPNGARLAASLRRAYRDVYIGKIDVPVPAPDPIAESDEFVEWMLRPMLAGALDSFSFAEYAIWRSRPDVQAAYPDIVGGSGPGYRNWLSNDPVPRQVLTDLSGSPERAQRTLEVGRAATAVERRPFGWSVIAYAASELGVGEAGRRMASAVGLSGVPSELVAVPIGNLSRQQHRPTVSIRDRIGFESAIVCVNADQAPHIAAIMQLGRLRGSVVGLWFWELAEFPDRFRDAFDPFDEIWVASEFNREAIQAKTDKLVRRVVLPITLPTAPTSFTRRSLGMPDDSFVFLTNFDYLSVHERKNPIGTIRAYMRAFGPDDGATLVVKSINSHHRTLHAEQVRSIAEGRPDIVFLDGYVTSAAMKAMIELSDAYVSLHRAEGYGLNMADAMAHGTPVIATGYSGNMDFMTAQTSELIAFELIEVGRGADPYPASAVWADPDLGAAAAAMRRLHDDPAHAAALAERAGSHVRARFSPEQISRTMAPLLVSGLKETEQ
ncbi:glycosyltransferase [Catellatospora paridis]|uniref:glycosyltransferase n=1 Tax=Catellatospora paridis TaxID=1617086 RepID=UPI0012D3C3E1|nr:glycosyltransferase [Catellatospora paridis]